MAIDIVADGQDQLFEISEDAASDAVNSQVAEETLDHIEPRSRCGREVYMEVFVLAEPAFDRRVFMRRVVITDDMDLLSGWYGLIDQAEELQPLQVTMTLLT